MRTNLITIFLLLFTISIGQTKNTTVVDVENNLIDPLVSLHFDKVVAYNFNYDSASHQKQWIYNELDLKQFRLQQIETFSHRILDRTTISQLINIVSNASTYGENHAACFDPRLGFTFFDSGQEVFTIHICFECGFLESTSTLPATLQKYYDEDTNETDDNGHSGGTKPGKYRHYLTGFSKKGEKKLLDLCAKLKMFYCKDN